jgi:hypothetical protein
MTLPHTNTTCDVYRAGNGPPAAPDVAGVRCHLTPKGASTLTTVLYTHVLLVPPTTDVRDGYVVTSLQANPGNTATVQLGVADRVYVPDRNGTLFRVVLVRRQGQGTGLDHKVVLLARDDGGNIPWPTDNV